MVDSSSERTTGNGAQGQVPSGQALASRPLVPSDRLADLREVAIRIPALQPLLGRVPALRVVVDANVILRQIEFVVASRRNVTARTSLQELIASGTIVAYASRLLEAEVSRHVPQIATRRGVPLHEVEAAWVACRAQIHFYEPRAPTEEASAGAVDRDDLPYRNVWDELGLIGVYTDNHRHLTQLGAPVLEFDVFMLLRDYARAEAVEVAIRFGAGATILLGLVAVRGLVAVIVTMARFIARLPPAVRVVLLTLGAIALLDPEIRKKATQVAQSWLRRLAAAGARLRPGIDEIGGEYVSAVQKSQEEWAAAQRRFPVRRRPPPLWSRARAICAAAETPIAEVELEQRIRTDGLVTRARDFRRYLRRVLRSDERLQEVSRGMWVLRPPSTR